MFLRVKKLVVVDDVYNLKKFRGYKYNVGNFDLSGKNFYDMLLFVNGCCFCCDILSLSFKFFFVSKCVVRYGYW